MKRSLTRVIRPWLAAWLVVVAAGTLLPAQALQLADGRVLLAEVDSAEVSGDGLRVRRLDNGGVLDLRWEQLSPATATMLKQRFDLVARDDGELLVRADEVSYEDCGRCVTVIGRVLDREADPIVVAKQGHTYPIARDDLLGMRAVDVPASQVYTTQEFYTVQLAEIDPGESADKHMLLADNLIRFRDYEHAAEHLERAGELGNSKDPDKLAKMVDRLTRYKQAAAELGLLEQLQVAKSRGQLRDFKKGREIIAQFEEQYPDSKLQAEFERARARFEVERSRVLTQKVADQWRRAIRSLAEKKVLDKDFSLQAARAYAENEMTDEIVERLAGQLEIESDEVRELWQQRSKYPAGKRTEHFSYGVGSWVLGAKEILKDTAVGKDGEKATASAAPSGNDARQIERFTKLLREAMERRRKATQSGQQPKQQTDQGWWQDASRKERVNWLSAYYAEYGGQLEVTYASVAQCMSCFGRGKTMDFDANGQQVQTECFLCQGTKWRRSFKAY